MSEQSIESLLERVSDPVWHVRQFALRDIGKSGKWEPRVAEALQSSLQDENSRVRSMAAWSIGQFGDQAVDLVEHLRPLLEDKDNFAIKEASEAIGRIGTADAETVAVLYRNLEHKDYSRYGNAKTALGWLNKKGKSPAVNAQLDDLVACLHAEDPQQQQRGIEALRRLGPMGMGHLDDLVRLAQSNHKTTRKAAISAMYYYGEAAVVALDLLLEAARDEDLPTRQSALNALTQLGPAAAPAVPLFIGALDESETGTRRIGLLGLQALGPKAAEAVPRLLEVLAEPVPEEDTKKNLYARCDVAKALTAIGDPSAISGMIAWVAPRTDDGPFKELVAYEDLRRTIIREIGKFGPAAIEVADVLVTRLGDDRFEEAAREALEAMGWSGVAKPQEGADKAEQEPGEATGPGSPEDHEPSAPPVERVLTEGETTAIDTSSRLALKHIGLAEEETDPKTIVTAICGYVDTVRKTGEVPTDQDLLLGIGALWGKQLVAVLDWTWVHLSWESGFKTYGVVPEDRAVVCIPLDVLPDHLQKKTPENTTLLLFNMIVAGNQGPAAPGSYTIFS